MTATRTLADLHADHGIPGDPDGSATKLTEILRLTKTQAELLRPLIYNYCENAERGRVRSQEKRAFRFGRVADRSQLERLLDETGFVPDVGRLAWGQMTADDHLARAAFLDKMASGLNDSAERHREAARIITEAGVTCLNDLREVAA